MHILPFSIRVDDFAILHKMEFLTKLDCNILGIRYLAFLWCFFNYLNFLKISQNYVLELPNHSFVAKCVGSSQIMHYIWSFLSKKTNWAVIDVDGTQERKRWARMLNAATIAQQKHVTNKGEGVWHVTLYRKGKNGKESTSKKLDGSVPLPWLNAILYANKIIPSLT